MIQEMGREGSSVLTVKWVFNIIAALIITPSSDQSQDSAGLTGHLSPPQQTCAVIFLEQNCDCLIGKGSVYLKSLVSG